MEMGVYNETKGDKVFTIVNYTVVTLFFLTVLYPVIYIVSASFSSPNAVLSGKVWLFPVDPGLAGYKAIFSSNSILIGFRNSIYYTVVGTLINLIITVIAAYPLSRPKFHGKNIIMALFVFTMMISGGLIPTYLLVKDIGILNTPWAMLLPGALSVYNMIVCRTYFQMTIPNEMLEAAQMDGCGDIKFLTRIVLPLSGPVLAAIGLFYAVGHWNQYFTALIYLNKSALYPIQIILRDILVTNQADLSMMMDAEELELRQGLSELLKYSLIVVSSLPMLILYPFAQKYFVKGVMVGSLKG